MGLEVQKGGINTYSFYIKCEKSAIDNGYGAVNIFNGIVRGEGNISALSFDIYEPLLIEWFNKWQEEAKSNGTIIHMIHSYGDVKIGETSFICALLSKHRKNSLDIYKYFIEDFKSNAPIWKYDIINGKREYALNRSKKLNGAGLLL